MTTLNVEVRLDYDAVEPTALLLQIEAAETEGQRIVSSDLSAPGTDEMWRVPAEDGIGERLWLRCEDAFRCTYRARIEVTRDAAPLDGLAETPLHALPGEAVPYLLPSRFCPSARFEALVEDRFGALSGGAKIAAMRDWVEASFSYVPGASNADTDAVDTFLSRRGICRDYAHVLVSLARAATIPARMVAVYSAAVTPPDFHAVAEVYLGGAWRMVDPTGMSDPAELAVIGVGRDATDIAFLTSFAPISLKYQSVSVSRG
ncbi:transglutaminase family protein [Tropicimonas sp. IMCC34011]|uniref:transglutaminase-like domain-containing protein n=1 Tax=Tropicimonas sp. IMCC34011 TaxID=2248759 RepID=UPI000E27A917|nr:transglutaminase family protein [Tropicimonas sp. IMCC34011]